MAEPLREEQHGDPLPGASSLDEFLADEDEDRWVEWVAGEVVVMSPASVQHQKIGLFLKGLLQLFVEHHDLGVVLDAPFTMALREQDRAREPDLLFIAREHLDRLAPARLEGPADVVVEIVSPESLGRDRGEKFVEYEAAGVREYWLVDPQRRQAEIHRLADDGLYHPATPEADGAPRSRVLPGFPLRPQWLFADPRPKVLDAARELGLV